jgi:hypothetical protein
MSEFMFLEPSTLSNSTFGGKKPVDNFRVKSLLSILGQGKLLKRNEVTPIKLSYQFATIPLTFSQKLKIRDILQLSIPGATKKEIESFLLSAISNNIVFHKKLYAEVVTALGYLEQSNHIASFVSIYRLFEQISLCLPIITLIEKAQFPATFDDYKLLIDSKAKSDLSVLRKYAENIMDRNIGNISIKFDFSRTQRPVQNIDLLKTLIPKKVQSTVIVSNTNSTISISFKYIHLIIIGFRNQYFHYLFHENNIDYDKLEFPEEFLEVCNPLFLNYYSRFFIDLISAEYTIWG